MRKDMHKVIAEPGRRGGHDFVKSRVTIDRDDDTLPKREGIRRKGSYDRKNSQHNYNPLRRYLASKVGQQWNAVFSDICANNDLRNKVQGEVREHVGWMVHTAVEVIDGLPHATDGYRIWRDFWVHPDTGVLMAAPRDKRYRWRGWKTNHEQVAIDASTKYVKVDGIWYKVTFKPFIHDQCDDSVGTFDCIFLGSLSRSLDTARRQLRQEWGAEICAVKKRQIGSAEIRKMLKARDEDRAKAAQLELRKAGKKTKQV
ncbi:MAG: hypothetical protein IT343_16910 [Candidatus Melainabacteria bacterium]|nr:hypothetical protein [Candidatus Melainabacteria bacterium]